MSLGGVAIWTMHFVGMVIDILFLLFKKLLCSLRTKFTQMKGSMHLYDDKGERQTIKYRIDLTIISLVTVVLLCYVGLLVSSRDKVFTTDKSEAIEKYVKDARSLTIQEIRMMQHKTIFLWKSLFRNIFPILSGGFITAAGVCVMHYIGMVKRKLSLILRLVDNAFLM
jgi:hypothetical protein